MKIDRRIERSQRTRKNLLLAAKTVFLENGYKNTTINKINEYANTAHGTFYVHFPNGKDEILSVLMKDILDEFYEITDVTFNPISKEEAFTINHKQIQQFISKASKHKKFLSVYYEAIGASSTIKNHWEEFLLHFLEQIKKDIQYAINHQLAKQNLNYEIVAKMLLYTGEQFLWEIVQDKNNASIEQIAENITEIYMYGLYNQNNSGN